MPGSTTIGHSHALVMLEYPDAERLVTVLRELSRLLSADGPDRITDAQVAALCAGKPQSREEFAQWTQRLSEYLKGHL